MDIKINNLNEKFDLLEKKLNINYCTIDNLINKKFDELEPDILSVLTRTLMDLDDRIQIYKRGLQHGTKVPEAFSVLGRRTLITQTKFIISG